MYINSKYEFTYQGKVKCKELLNYFDYGLTDIKNIQLSYSVSMLN